LIEKCPDDCISAECTDCGDFVCENPENFFNCEDCPQPPIFCFSDKDCEGYCINGLCSNDNYFVGDAVCSFPLEDCSSSDCSCSLEAGSKGKDDYPILLIHGFTSNAEKMKKLQRAIAYSLDYTNGGEIIVSEFECPSTKNEVVYVGTYYEAKEDTSSLPDFVRQSMQKTHVKDKKSTFVESFSRLVDKVKTCTDSDKVNIIAHSWGALIARKYIAEGSNMKNINRLILLGSPNKGGIYGTQTYKLFEGLETTLGDRKKLLQQCSSIGVPSIALSLMDGRDITGECQELQKSTSMSNTIFDFDETPGIIEYYAIAGNTDGKGDGVVTVESASLKGAVFNKVLPCDQYYLQ
jgi:pimeloyl-ACP methyl ester carboxylesterase